MKTITQFIILSLPLLLVNANQYCDSLVKECRKNFRTKCSSQNVTIKNCCDLKLFYAPTGMYKISKGTFDTTDAYCDMTTGNGG